MSNVATIPHAAASAVLTPLAMIDKAITSGASVETLERLMALQERYEANEAKKAFDAAIGAAKAQIPPILKNKGADFESKRTGTTTSYRYETLPALAKVLEPILHANGLSYRYSSHVDANQISVTCIISHIAGHKEETALQCAPDSTGNKNAVQAIGSAVTYLQRYTLKLALGISASDDDDGVGSTNPELNQDITADQFRELRDLLTESGSKEEDMLAYVKAENMEAMTLAQYAKAKAAMVYKINLKKQKAGK